MGRELKRVPMHFDWPTDEVWVGYLNPHYVKCENCGGDGTTVAHKRLSDLVSLLMLSGSDAHDGRVHPYFKNIPLYNTEGKLCGEDMTELTTGLSGRELGTFGHDSSDGWVATDKIINAAGLDPDTWGTCPECNGEGVPIDAFKLWDTWEPIEPPEGEGYQIWETVSEGSPISPVFATPEELAEYMSHTRWGADRGTSVEQWMKFITGPGWAPSMIIMDGVIMNGVDAV